MCSRTMARHIPALTIAYVRLRSETVKMISRVVTNNEDYHNMTSEILMEHHLDLICASCHVLECCNETILQITQISVASE